MMSFSPAERVLMRSHAKVLDVMAAEWEELLNRRDPRTREALQIREFRDLYRSLASLQMEHAAVEEDEQLKAA